MVVTQRAINYSRKGSFPNEVPRVQRDKGWNWPPHDSLDLDQSILVMKQKLSSVIFDQHRMLWGTDHVKSTVSNSNIYLKDKLYLSIDGRFHGCIENFLST